MGVGEYEWKQFNLQQNGPLSGHTDRKSHHSIRSFDQECKKCGFVAREPFLMANHKRTCNGKRHLTCTVCYKVLSRYDALAEHMRGIHGIGEKVECKYCGKNFKYRPQMYQHQAVCHLKPQKSQSCTGNTLLSTQAADMQFLTFPYDQCATSAGVTGALGASASNKVHS